MRQLTAVRFERAMTSGRTRPLVLACEEADANADDPTPTEFLVKLRGSVQAGGVGLTCELIAAEVARFLDLPVPEPAVVEITEEFVRSVPDVESREALRKSLGLNFGSRYLSGGYGTWPTGKVVPLSLRPVASEIITFDAFIQNPDRRAERPNLLWKGEELFCSTMSWHSLFSMRSAETPNQQLKDGEAAALFRTLLTKHPELSAEAEALAASVIGGVAMDDIARETEDAVRALDLDDLNSRAGSHSYGYVEPTEAAWELIEEAVMPLIEDIQRRLDAGQPNAGLATCAGIVLGLYRLRHDANDGRTV
jgi:hypothetical protein